MDAGRHPLIEVITNAEVIGCEGGPGEFHIRVRKHPRYVREELCVACGQCVDACPMVGGNEFDVGLKARKAIYRPFPQSVPSAYVIDPDACLNLLGYLTEKQREKFEKRSSSTQARSWSRSAFRSLTRASWETTATGASRTWSPASSSSACSTPRA